MSQTDDTLLVSSDDLPLWSQSSLPETGEVVMIVEEQNFDAGGLISAAYRLPVERLVPNNQRQGNVYSLAAVDSGITVPVGTVVPGYVEPFEPYEVKRANATDETSKAQFLIIGQDQNIDDNLVIQSGGFYTFDEPHDYLIGQTYYLSDTANGGVTNTPPPGYVQPLFVAVDNKTLRILLGV